MTAFRDDSFNLTGQGQPERVKLAMVSAAFFPMLDIKPVLGRSSPRTRIARRLPQ
jgi:hypothetical protein